MIEELNMLLIAGAGALMVTVIVIIVKAIIEFKDWIDKE